MGISILRFPPLKARNNHLGTFHGLGTLELNQAILFTIVELIQIHGLSISD
jgi:hypothetical protein